MPELAPTFEQTISEPATPEQNIEAVEQSQVSTADTSDVPLEAAPTEPAEPTGPALSAPLPTTAETIPVTSPTPTLSRDAVLATHGKLEPAARQQLAQALRDLRHRSAA